MLPSCPNPIPPRLPLPHLPGIWTQWVQVLFDITANTNTCFSIYKSAPPSCNNWAPNLLLPKRHHVDHVPPLSYPLCCLAKHQWEKMSQITKSKWNANGSQGAGRFNSVNFQQSADSRSPSPLEVDSWSYSPTFQFPSIVNVDGFGIFSTENRNERENLSPQES